jgi:hypothetical protein
MCLPEIVFLSSRACVPQAWIDFSRRSVGRWETYSPCCVLAGCCSEAAILATFPFHRYKFGFISVEHNFEELKRAKIRWVPETVSVLMLSQSWAMTVLENP